jgi:hypothetical protein
MPTDEELAEMQWETDGGSPVNERLAIGQIAADLAAHLFGKAMSQLTAAEATRIDRLLYGLNPPDGDRPLWQS